MSTAPYSPLDPGIDSDPEQRYALFAASDAMQNHSSHSSGERLGAHENARRYDSFASDGAGSCDIDADANANAASDGSGLFAAAAARPAPRRSLAAYVRSGDLLELILWCAAMAGLAATPRLAMSVNERPIPYQTSQAGDNMIELLMDHEFLEAETVSNFALAALSVALPLTAQAALAAMPRSGSDAGDLHRTVCAYAAAFGVSMFAGEFVKRYCGYLRPHFYDRCGWDGAECDADIDGNEFSGRRSFVSGHASMSFCGLTLLSLYLQRLFGAGKRGGGRQRRRDRLPLRRVGSLLSLLPVFLAVFISSSRVRDNYHHPADVVGGAVLGAAGAVWSFGVWFSV